jgi:hypothetical protein
MDGTFADTRTDAQGRDRLCGIPTTKIDGLVAVRGGSTQAVFDQSAPVETLWSISRCRESHSAARER